MFYSRLIDNLLLARDVPRFKKLKFSDDIFFAEFDQYLIRYRLCGEGERCIIFIPNAPNMIEHYDRLVDLLRPDFRILIFELPGFGFSVPKKSGYDYSLQTCTDLTIELLDHLHLKNCIFSLPCLSGFITLQVASQRPDLVGNIVCIQTLCWNDQEQWINKINKKVPLQSPVVGQFAFWFSKEKIAKSWYEKVVPDLNTRSRFIDIATSNFKKGAHYALASTIQALFRSETPKIASTDINSVVIWGNSDKSHKRNSQWSMLRYFSNFEPHEFESSGHFPDLEHPDRFARILKNRFSPGVQNIPEYQNG